MRSRTPEFLQMLLRLVIRSAALIYFMGPASAFELPDSKPVMDWFGSAFGSSSWGEPLVRNSEPPLSSLETSTSQITVDFLINQCATDIETSPDAFFAPSRVSVLPVDVQTEQIEGDPAPAFDLKTDSSLRAQADPSATSDPSLLMAQSEWFEPNKILHPALIPLPRARTDIPIQITLSTLSYVPLLDPENEVNSVQTMSARSNPVRNSDPAFGAILLAATPAARLGQLPSNSFHSVGSITTVVTGQHAQLHDASGIAGEGADAVNLSASVTLFR